MLVETAKGVVTKQAGYNNSWSSYSTKQQYAGMGTTSYFTTIVVLQTPSFLGASKTLNVTLRVLKQGNNSNPTLRWALTTSDVNRDKYINTISEITAESDESQIVSGIHSFNNINASGVDSTITINTQKLKPSTTYYLYLWGYESGNWLTVYQPSGHSVSLDYSSGIVYIGDGSKFNSYLVYIHDGTRWDLYIPYLHDGVKWNLCS